MRDKITKILKELEVEDSFKIDFYDSIDGFPYSITEYFSFPNHRLLASEFDKKWPNKSGEIIIPHSTAPIVTELKRMELDGLVSISKQVCKRYATTTYAEVRDYDEGYDVETESIILTTKGKSNFKYFLYQLEEQRFAVYALVLSLISIAVSVVALISKNQFL